MEGMQRLQWTQAASAAAPARIRLTRSGSRSRARAMATKANPSSKADWTVAVRVIPPSRMIGVSRASRNGRA